ncbi:Uncharacterised protein [Vibrio cholerae]|uniref:Uncharacterized protein n=1 Tax=Vibrio cholerae TaxID=666 RepID=A0A655SH42_VIBCL|nr:Uncharacterised protein [Vibrio cholerae]CSB24132.1 Uncharacterised protein [Vibrio cholerae]
MISVFIFFTEQSHLLCVRQLFVLLQHFEHALFGWAHFFTQEGIRRSRALLLISADVAFSKVFREVWRHVLKKGFAPLVRKRIDFVKSALDHAHVVGFNVRDFMASGNRCHVIVNR